MAAQEQSSTEDRAKRVLEEIGADQTRENIAQISVFLEAFEIFIERNRRHKAQWRVGGIQGLLVDIRKKCERMWNEFMLSPQPPKDFDSALDQINYLAFFIQAHREEQASGVPVGKWIWPKPLADEDRAKTSGVAASRSFGQGYAINPEELQ